MTSIRFSAPLFGLLVTLATGCAGADGRQAPVVSEVRAHDGPAPEKTAASCYCFHWVHLAENGVYCRTTLAECQALHRSLDEHRHRTDCEQAAEPHCQSYACEDSGAACFTLGTQ